MPYSSIYLCRERVFPKLSIPFPLPQLPTFDQWLWYCEAVLPLFTEGGARGLNLSPARNSSNRGGANRPGTPSQQQQQQSSSSSSSTAAEVDRAFSPLRAYCEADLRWGNFDCSLCLFIRSQRQGNIAHLYTNGRYNEKDFCSIPWPGSCACFDASLQLQNSWLGDDRDAHQLSCRPGRCS